MMYMMVTSLLHYQHCISIDSKMDHLKLPSAFTKNFGVKAVTKTSVLLTWEIPESFKSEAPLKVGHPSIPEAPQKDHVERKQRGVMLWVSLLDPVQPAECGGAGQPQEEVDHPAAARHRLLLCADELGQQCRWPPAAGVHPNGSGPAEDQAQPGAARDG